MQTKVTAEQSFIHYCTMLWNRWNGTDNIESIQQAGKNHGIDTGDSVEHSQWFSGFCAGVYCAIAEVEAEKGMNEV